MVVRRMKISPREIFKEEGRNWYNDKVGNLLQPLQMCSFIGDPLFDKMLKDYEEVEYLINKKQLETFKSFEKDVERGVVEFLNALKAGHKKMVEIEERYKFLKNEGGRDEAIKKYGNEEIIGEIFKTHKELLSYIGWLKDKMEKNEDIEIGEPFRLFKK